MPHLLTLPSEIRDNIIENVLLSPRPTSETFSDLIRTHYQPIHGAAIFAARNEEPFVNFADTLQPRASSSSLLLTCKQLGRETEGVMHRLHQGKSLDLQIEAKYVQRCAWFLTWRWVPKPKGRVDRLYAEFQTIGVLQHTTLTHSVSSGLEHLIPLVFTMLQHVFRIPAETIWVEHLEINFVEAKEIELLPPKGVHGEQWCKRLGLEDGVHTILGTHDVLKPEMLCRLLQEDIEGTLADVEVLDLKRSM